jgi:hypothetical protein
MSKRWKGEKPSRTLMPFFIRVGLNSYFKLYFEGTPGKTNVFPLLELSDVKTRIILNPREKVVTVKIECYSWIEIDKLMPIVMKLKKVLNSTNLRFGGSKLFLVFKGLRGNFIGLPKDVLDFFKTFEGGRQELLICPFSNISYRAMDEGDDLDFNLGFWDLGYSYEDQKWNFIYARRGNTSYEHFLTICHSTLETLSSIKGTYPESMEVTISPSIRCDSFIHDYEEHLDIYIEVERDWRDVIPKSKKYRRLRKRKFKVLFYLPAHSKEKCSTLKLKLPNYEFKFYKYLPSSPIITQTVS